MIDLHSHVIFGVDDGPSDMEQSLSMIKEAERVGIETIVATPHYHESIFEADKVEENFLQLQYRAEKSGVSIKIGYEVFVNPQSPFPLRNRKKMSLNRSGKMLLELPFNVLPSDCGQVIMNLKAENITPVIAHPERNRNFLRNIGSIIPLIKAGCLIQVDVASIIGIYGHAVRDFARKLVQMNMVDVVASNAHCPEDYAKRYLAAYQCVEKWAGRAASERLFKRNAAAVLDNLEDGAYKNVIGINTKA